MDATGAIGAWQKLLETNLNYPEHAWVEQLIAQAKQHQKLLPQVNRGSNKRIFRSKIWWTSEWDRRGLGNGYANNTG